MAKTELPHWQQVVVQALTAVPDANGGQEAWDKLAPDEQRAVIDFAAAHCEGDVQPLLEEVRQQLKPHSEWRWLWNGAIYMAGFVAGYMLLRWLEDLPGAWADVVACLMALAVIVDDLRPSPTHIRRIWGGHSATYDSTLAALEKMHDRLCGPWWKRSDWRGAALWTLFLAIAVFLDVYRYMK